VPLPVSPTPATGGLEVHTALTRPPRLGPKAPTESPGAGATPAAGLTASLVGSAAPALTESQWQRLLGTWKGSESHHAGQPAQAAEVAVAPLVVVAVAVAPLVVVAAAVAGVAGVVVVVGL
jgi:hypothetical protein